MRAVRYVGEGRVQVAQIVDPSAGTGEVLLAPLAVGLCGTDIHIIDGDYAARAPVTLGHEVCARVVGVGEGTATLAVGDLVTVEPHLYCGVCVHCQTGRVNLCPSRQAPGVHLDGGMAELVVVAESIAYRLPADTPPPIGAMTEPLACAVHGMDRLQPTSGRGIAVFGVGPAGALLISLAVKAGLTPIVSVETRGQRRDLALRMGADVALDPAAPDFARRMADLSDGDGFPYLIDAVGSSRVLTQAITVASRGATVLVFGVARPDDRLDVSPYEIYAKELSILGTAINPFTHRRAANLVNHLGLDRLDFGFFGLDQIDDAFRAQRDATFDKVIVTPNGDLA